MEAVERDTPVRTRGDDPDDFVARFSEQMLDSLKRCDQRTRGQWYINGLLSVPGRKTMRALAAAAEHGAAEQSLHHFISNSSWAWEPVRQALARHLDRVLLPHAWVLDPMAIPKAGAHSVGVEESYRSDFGRVVNSQQAYGVSLAGERVSVPVNWGLKLPPQWLEDQERRRRARIPDGLPALGVEAVIVRTVAELADPAWGLRRRPAVVDARGLQLRAVVGQLARRELPFVVRVDGTTPVIAPDPGRPAAGRVVLPARQLAELGKTLCKLVSWTDPERMATRTALVGRARVALAAAGGPVPPQKAASRLVLVCGWPVQKGGTPELWLSNLVDVPPAVLLRLGQLTRRVGKDFAEISLAVGMRDFEGRSYAGWHRHVTLCSVAHAIAALSPARNQGGDAEELSA